ncbi:hypothetical protein [Mucilaginibacter myungsuensis]|uniref:Uncharacterized protein n=1 Tax=Mucilaginibacter myungsuensis TaxID=649104 RepID=A0A929PWV0_9SPHI|nr:hypothetical protein [Mucilaginibacter myungsuensis]MBE9662481.1 hypothetical protein [Mucilaginibacter myungsuensis]MDN3597901.1 hypothetical protein [Mucilaginibacter myungsuensis]
MEYEEETGKTELQKIYEVDGVDIEGRVMLLKYTWPAEQAAPNDLLVFHEEVDKVAKKYGFTSVL